MNLWHTYRSLVALCALFSVSVYGLYESTPSVTILNQESFATSVLGSPDMWLIQCHKEDCVPCENFVPQFQELAGRLQKYGVRTGAIDCTVEVKLCEELNIGYTPTVMVYSESPQPNPYTKKTFRTPLKYTGNLKAKDIDKFIQSKMHHTVIRVENAEKFAVTVSEAKKAKVNVAILFTERESTAALYKSLSHSFEDSISFVEVPAGLSAITSEYNIEKYPTLIIVRHDDQPVVVYDGNIKSFEQMQIFLTPFASTFRSRAAKEEQDSKSRSIKDELPTYTILTSESFEDKVTSNQHAWIVLVDDEEEASTLGLPEWWITVSKKSQGMISAGQLTCKDNESSPSTIGAFMCAQKSKNVCVFPYGKPKKKIIQTLRDGDAQKLKCFASTEAGGENAVEAAFDTLPDTVTAVDEQSLQGFLGAAMSQSLVALVLLSSKTTPPPVWKNIALTAANFSLTGFIPDPSPALLQQLSIDKVPAIVCMYADLQGGIPQEDGTSLPPNAQVSIKVDRYSGPTSVTGVMRFLFSTVIRSGYTGRNQDTGSSSSSPGAAEAPVFSGIPGVHELTASSWDSLCGLTSSHVCAIAFTRQDDASSSIDLLREISERYSSGNPFVFLYVDGECYQSFANQFDVQPHKLPTAVAYSPKRARYSNFIGAFGTDKVKAFLDSVARGRATTVPLSERPLLDETCAATDAEVIEQDEEMDDVMAEIRREEALMKQRLKEELEQERLEAERRRKEEEELAKAPKKIKKKKKKTKKADEL